MRKLCRGLHRARHRITRAIKVTASTWTIISTSRRSCRTTARSSVEVKAQSSTAQSPISGRQATRDSCSSARAGGIFDDALQRWRSRGSRSIWALKLPIAGLKASIGYAHLNGRYDADTVPDGKGRYRPRQRNISRRIASTLRQTIRRGRWRARYQTQFYRPPLRR